MTVMRLISLAAGFPVRFYSPLLPLPITEEEAATAILKTGRIYTGTDRGQKQHPRGKEKQSRGASVFCRHIYVTRIIQC